MFGKKTTQRIYIFPKCFNYLVSAKRELFEETGYEIQTTHYLGKFSTDSGAMTAIVPAFSGKVTVEEEPEQEDTEAIKGKFVFSLEEIMQAFRKPDSSLEVLIDGETKCYPLRDPFLVCALFFNQLNHSILS